MAEKVNNKDIEVKEEEEESIFSLFVCEDYIIKEYLFKNLKQSLLCSNMSSTDHDLTGQIVWPAAKLMSWFISMNQNIFKNQYILELGAGTGLAGFIASQLANKTLITDGNEVVLRLIERNIQEGFCNDNTDNNNNKSIKSLRLMWGEKQQITQFITNDSESFPDVIIGADIILWPSFILPLVLTLRWLLSLKPRTSKCFISYVVRAHSTTNLFLSTANEYGLNVTIIPSETFLPNYETISDDEKESLLFKNSYVPPSSDMFIFQVELSEIFLQQFDSTIIHNNQSLLDFIPAEDPNWKDLADHMNSPC